MKECIVRGCDDEGHAHHIVYRSHGGLDNELNIIALCPYHHNLGPMSPHRNRNTDLMYKRELQEKYFELFKKDSYTIPEIAALIGISEKKTMKALLKVTSSAGVYKKEDVVRRLMGGRLY